MKKTTVPASFKPYLWSYDFDKLDLETNKETIIENVLTWGAYDVTKELFGIYSKDEIMRVFSKIKKSDFNKQSVNYWNLILN